jgi:hypothetical protein
MEVDKYLDIIQDIDRYISNLKNRNFPVIKEKIQEYFKTHKKTS